MLFTAEKSSVLTETQTVKAASARRMRVSPEGSTRSNSSRLSIGESSPTSDTASVASAIKTKSETERVCTM